MLLPDSSLVCVRAADPELRPFCKRPKVSIRPSALHSAAVDPDLLSVLVSLPSIICSLWFPSLALIGQNRILETSNDVMDERAN